MKGYLFGLYTSSREPEKQYTRCEKEWLLEILTPVLKQNIKKRPTGSGRTHREAPNNKIVSLWRGVLLLMPRGWVVSPRGLKVAQLGWARDRPRCQITLYTILYIAVFTTASLLFTSLLSFHYIVRTSAVLSIPFSNKALCEFLPHRIHTKRSVAGVSCCIVMEILS